MDFCDVPNRGSAEVASEFEAVAALSWSPSLPLTVLLARINQVSVLLTHHDEAQDSRVSPVFTQRSFRHYQTLGCIDASERSGKTALYGFRHFVQAVLVRKLLGERMKSGVIAGLLQGRTTAETKRMFFEGIEISIRRADPSRTQTESPTPAPSATWRRLWVAPGVELHVAADVLPINPPELKQILAKLEKLLNL